MTKPDAAPEQFDAVVAGGASRACTWSEKYATQPEILDYLRFVADRYDLRADIEFATSVASAHWDEQDKRWDLATDRGTRLRCRYFITADFDPLRDEGLAYADALEAEGTQVRRIRARGHTHTSTTMVGVIISGAPVRAEIAEGLRAFFPPSGTSAAAG